MAEERPDVDGLEVESVKGVSAATTTAPVWQVFVGGGAPVGEFPSLELALAFAAEQQYARSCQIRYPNGVWHAWFAGVGTVG